MRDVSPHHSGHVRPSSRQYRTSRFWSSRARAGKEKESKGMFKQGGLSSSLYRLKIEEMKGSITSSDSTGDIQLFLWADCIMWTLGFISMLMIVVTSKKIPYRWENVCSGGGVFWRWFITCTGCHWFFTCCVIVVLSRRVVESCDTLETTTISDDQPIEIQRHCPAPRWTSRNVLFSTTDL